MFINKKIVLAAAAILTLGATSCRKLLDVNTNPNIAQAGTKETLLPAGQLYLGSAMGVDMEVNGSIWSQFWTQTPVASQYIVLEQYAPGQDQFNYPWSNLYSAASNFNQLYWLADSGRSKPYKAVALLMQAYTYQVLTDGWGDVPFTNALRGQYIDSHIVSPRYDSQRVVYMGIIRYIDSAKKLLAASSDQLGQPLKGDLIYGSTATFGTIQPPTLANWVKFANTLKLKVLLRMAYVEPTTAKAMIDSLYLTNPQFIGPGEDAKIDYGFNTNTKNPLYAEFSSTTMGSIQNVAGSATAIDSMNSNGDPRAFLFYNPDGTGLGVTGIPQGTYNVSRPSGAYSIPSPYVAGDAQDPNSSKAPVNLLTSWESYLLQAEVVARGWQPTSSGMTDDALFFAGIQANFSYSSYASALSSNWGPTAYSDYISAGGYWTQYPIGGSTEDKIRFIITQKWFAMNGNQGFEAWTEWRRTGYPDFLVRPANSLIGSGKPARFLYPTSESTGNTNFPGVKGLQERVWWDKF